MLVARPEELWDTKNNVSRTAENSSGVEYCAISGLTLRLTRGWIVVGDLERTQADPLIRVRVCPSSQAFYSLMLLLWTHFAMLYRVPAFTNFAFEPLLNFLTHAFADEASDTTE